MFKNEVVNINLVGGIAGLFSSPRKIVEETIHDYNRKGYKVRVIINPNPNPLFVLLSYVCLVVTLFIYAPVPGYMIVFEDLDQKPR